MRLSIEVKDEALSKRISEYISSKNIKANDLMLELLAKFFGGEHLDYKIKDAKRSAKILNYDLEEDKDYKLFEQVDDIAKYSKELRENAWRE